VLRVAEQYTGTDTGRQRRANEDSVLARSPLFVVADGMGGAQAGEVASRIAVEAFQQGLASEAEPERELATLAQRANARIHELSHTHAEQAGMGTTLTAVYVGPADVAIAHVGDSRAYCMRDRELQRLTDDHSLVDELMRQGRLTPEEAVEHPQRSVITRALGPEGAVEVDTRSFQGRAGDVFLLCSDGLTTMVTEAQIAALLNSAGSLRDAGESLIAAANDAGGRDNITVVLLRLEDALAGAVGGAEEQVTATDLPVLPPTAGVEAVGQPVERAAPESPGAVALASEPLSDAAPPATREPLVPRRGTGPEAEAERRRKRRRRRLGVSAVVIVVLGVIGTAAFLAEQSVYFIGTNDRGLITVFRGVPYRLPGGVNLYTTTYVSGVSASTLAPQRRHALLDNSVRSENNAASLVRSLELGQLE
jgi:protein phosphatase